MLPDEPRTWSLIMWQRIGAMVFKELRQMARDPGTIAMMFFFPIIQLVIFGVAINNDPRHLPLVVESIGTIEDAVFGDGYAELTLARPSADGISKYSILMIRDGDGLWRVESM